MPRPSLKPRINSAKPLPFSQLKNQILRLRLRMTWPTVRDSEKLTVPPIYSDSPPDANLSGRLNLIRIALAVPFQVKIQQRPEEREDRRSEHNAHGAEQRNPAQEAEEKKQHGQAKSGADQQRL